MEHVLIEQMIQIMMEIQIMATLDMSMDG